MKDYDILLWLMKLKPESDKQRKAIESAERAFREVTENHKLDESIELFFDGIEKSYIVNKPSGELYKEYVDNCNDFDYLPVSQKAFTKAVKYFYNVNVKVCKINGKSMRAYT